MRNAEFSGEEKELMDLLEKVGLPDDLPEIALHDMTGPAHDTTGRIRDNVFRKVGQRRDMSNRGIKNLWSKVSVRLATAAILVLLLIVTIMGPGRVIAEFKEVFRLVPGFGLQPEQKLSVALPEKMTVDLDYMTLVIERLKADRESTVLSMEIYDLSEEFLHQYCPLTGQRRLEHSGAFIRGPYERLPQLVDEDGNHYEYFSSRVGTDVSFSNSEPSYEWSSEFTFDPLPSQTSKVILLLPDLRQEEETLKIEIPLVPREAFQEAIPKWPSTTLHDITVTASANVCNDETLINLAVIPEENNWHVIGRRYLISYVDVPYTLTDDRGRNYSYHPEKSSVSGYTDEEGLNVYHLRFDPVNPEAEYMKLSISSIWIIENEKASYPLQLSRLEKDHPVPMDEDIQLGHFSFQITGLRPYKSGIEVEFDLGPVGQETLISLERFLLEPAKKRPGRGFEVHGGGTQDDDDRLKTRHAYFHDQDFDEIILHVGYPLAEIKGSWELKIPLEVE